MSTGLADKAASFLSLTGATVKSLIKTMLSGGGVKVRDINPQGPLIVMGNGPSLKENLENDMDILSGTDTMAVNFAANAPEFTQLRPRFYVLADPHFFNSTDDPNIKKLMRNLSEATWPMTLFVPEKAKLPQELTTVPNISVNRFCFNGFEGFECIAHFAFRHGWGMPRPRNVIIPSIMLGIWLGYKDIYIIGADHTWTRTLSVDEQNRVVSIQPHFYKEDDHERERVTTTYHGVRMHSILESFSIAFRSYHAIRRYADETGTKIYNSTPGSFIDAFERHPLPASSHRPK